MAEVQRQQLVANVAKATNYPATQISNTLDALLDTIAATLKKGNAVKITGYLGLQPVTRKARVGRNPQTGEPQKIPARRAVKVKIGSKLKAAVAK